MNRRDWLATVSTLLVCGCSAAGPRGDETPPTDTQSTERSATGPETVTRTETASDRPDAEASDAPSPTPTDAQTPTPTETQTPTPTDTQRPTPSETATPETFAAGVSIWNTHDSSVDLSVTIHRYPGQTGTQVSSPTPVDDGVAFELSREIEVGERVAGEAPSPERACTYYVICDVDGGTRKTKQVHYNRVSTGIVDISVHSPTEIYVTGTFTN